MPFDGKSYTPRHAPVAARMRELAGTIGTNWCKGFMTDRLARHCLIGFLAEATTVPKFHALLPDLARAVSAVGGEARVKPEVRLRGTPDFIGAFNDHSATTFPDILRVIDAFAEIEAESALVA